MDERWAQIEDAHERTFRWILTSEAIEDEALRTPQCSVNNPEYKTNPFLKWLKNDEEPIFWISGKAASGKSTLMKYLYERPELVNILSRSYAKGHENLIFASFFFFDLGKSTLQKSYEGLLRALLHQVVKDREGLWHDVFDAKCRSIINNYRDRNKLLEEYLSTFDVRWSLADLQSALRTFASRKPQNLKVFLLIDGLDEFRLSDEVDDYLGYEDDEDATQARRNITAYRAIKELLLYLSTCVGFKLCLSSRPLQVFEDAFSKFPGFKLQDLTLNDIHQYVDDRLRNHPRIALLSEVEPMRTEAIIHEISCKASGVFLWVKLVVNIVLDALEAGDDIQQLENKIDEIPPELRGRNGLYAKMLASVLPEYQAEGIAMFSLLLAARSHLTELVLSFSRESSAFALECPIGRIPEPVARLKIDEIHRRLKSRCGGLLETVRNPYLSTWRSSHDHEEILRRVSWNLRPHISMDPSVSFLHRTVAEYLQGPSHPNDKWQLTRMQHSADLQLLISCLLRVKLIGRTAHIWELLDAVNDAFFYAGRIKKHAGFPMIFLLDEIKRAAKSLWLQGMSAGRPEDYDKDPGFGCVVLEARRNKGLPEGPVHPIVTIWGPRYGEYYEGKSDSSIMNRYARWKATAMSIFMVLSVLFPIKI